MSADNGNTRLDWKNSSYYAESLVKCSVNAAWSTLLDYRTWNPHFDGAIVTPVRGQRSSEGELVLIQDRVPYVKGEPPPEFYAETVKVIPLRTVVWCVYPKLGYAFRNFVDFSLEARAGGIRFCVRYYEQLQLDDNLLDGHRRESQTIYEQLAEAFKSYCEAHSSS